MIRKDYVKGSTHFGQVMDFGRVLLLPDSWVSNPTKKRQIVFVGHGQGECGNGSLAALNLAFGWTYWNNLKRGCDEGDLIYCFVTTAVRYDQKEIQRAVDFVERNFSYIPDEHIYVGHSLGSHGFGTFLIPDLAYLKKFRLWICSAPGGFNTLRAATNMKATGTLFWGFASPEDSTVPSYTTIQQVRDHGKALGVNPGHFLVTLFGPKFWASGGESHNKPIIELAAYPTKIQPGWTQGISPSVIPQMKWWQWAKANPRGSLFQLPSNPYVGPKFDNPPAPTPTGRRVSHWNVYGQNLKVQVVYTDGSKEILAPPSGISANNFWIPAVEGLRGSLSGPGWSKMITTILTQTKMAIKRKIMRLKAK
jgi:hypothetical protein